MGDPVWAWVSALVHAGSAGLGFWRSAGWWGRAKRACPVAVWVAGVVFLLPWASPRLEAQSLGPAALRGKHAGISAQLHDNPFQGPLVLESSETARRIEGDVYAVLEHPVAEVIQALSGAQQWCDVLILHLNTKRCRVLGEDTGNVQLELQIGRKYDEPQAGGSQVVFRFLNAPSGPDYLHVELQAPTGPFDTRDYRIVLEAVALREDSRRSFIHLYYGLSYGVISHMAMAAYLATLGRDKVGFTLEARAPQGAPPQLIRGMRGVVERNTLRYYLAVSVYLESLSRPAADPLEQRLQDWFTATERFPLQLHELSRAEYMDMKRRGASAP